MQDVGLPVDSDGATLSTLSTSEPAVTLHATDSNYNTSVLHVKTTREPTNPSTFSLMRVDIDNVTQIIDDALGLLTVASYHDTSVGATISAGGMHVYDGATVHTSGVQIPVAGSTITTGGLQIVDEGSALKSTADAVDSVSVVSTGATLTSSVMHLTSDTGSASSMKLLELSQGSTTKVSMYGTGNCEFTSITDAESPAIGQIVTGGGIGISKSLYTGGVVSVHLEETSIGSGTGSITTKGGVGVAKDMYVGGVLIVENSNIVSPAVWQERYSRLCSCAL